MIKLSSIKPNPNNPRIIKDDKFKQLVNSIKQFPKMMELRPIVVDADGYALGGNMRLAALKELKYTEVPSEWIKYASDLTEEQKREFIIKDNVGFGEWNWEQLANEWNDAELKEWGLDLPSYSSEFNEMTEDDLDDQEEFDPIGVSSGIQRVVFMFDDKDAAESYLKKLSVDFSKKGQAWQVNLTSKFI